MRSFTPPILALAIVAFCAATAVAQQPVEFTVTVKADIVKGSPSDHYITFAEPIEMPDLTLSAGIYVFTTLGSSVVQISSFDRSRQFAMFFTIPAQRAEVRDSYEVALVSTAAAAPRRLTKWYLPNRAIGFEFVYPNTEMIGER